MNLPSTDKERQPSAKSSIPSSSVSNQEKNAEDNFFLQAPTITLPKGGGAITAIDEKFSVNAVNGTYALNIPLPSPYSFYSLM